MSDEFGAAINGNGTLSDVFDRIQAPVVAYAQEQGSPSPSSSRATAGRFIGAPDPFILPDGTMAMSKSPATATRQARSGVFTSRKLAPYRFMAPFLLLSVYRLHRRAAGLCVLHEPLPRYSVGGRQFAGAASYVKVAGDAKFWGGVWNLVLFGIVQVPIMLGLAMFVAIVSSIVAKSMPRASSGWLLPPLAVPSVIAAIIWGYLYCPTFGPHADGQRVQPAAAGLPVAGAMIFSWPIS